MQNTEFSESDEPMDFLRIYNWNMEVKKFHKIDFKFNV